MYSSRHFLDVHFLFCYFGSSHSAADIADKRLVLFSYGSGLASSMFMLRVASDGAPGSVLDHLLNTVSDVRKRLDSRMKVDPADFATIMKLREDTHHCGWSSFALTSVFMLFFVIKLPVCFFDDIVMKNPNNSAHETKLKVVSK